MEKRYLGDGVYVMIRDGEDLVLTTENGLRVSNTIVLEPEVYRALAGYVTEAIGEQVDARRIAAMAGVRRREGA